MTTATAIIRFEYAVPTISELQPIVDEVLAVLKASGERMLAEFKRTTATWKTDVDFAVDIGTDGDIAFVTVGTDNEIYGYVNDGTRPHKIRAKNPSGRLAFNTGYRAKTIPGVVGSISGGAFGDLVRPQEVDHPGTEARNFAQIIADNEQQILPAEIQAAIERGLRRARLM